MWPGVESSALTFNEWKALGYHVSKGQKSMLRNAAGQAIFTKSQVDKTQRGYSAHNDYDYDHDYLDDHYWISADIGDR